MTRTRALPELSRAVADQIPDPDPGFFRTNIEVLLMVIRRSLGLSTRAPTIRQAQRRITDPTLAAAE